MDTAIVLRAGEVLAGIQVAPPPVSGCGRLKKSAVSLLEDVHLFLPERCLLHVNIVSVSSLVVLSHPSYGVVRSSNGTE